MARFQPVALVLYLTLVLALGVARLEPHLTLRFAAVHQTELAPVVAVTGAVERPGVYTLKPGARVADALAAAGGARDDADLSALDLALPVADAESVRVPVRGEHAAATPAAPKPLTNVNRAGLEELEAVPGIGPALAQRIVAYRPYRTLDDLLRVPGIGPRALERLRPYLTP